MYVIEIICGFKVVPNLWILIHLFTIRQQKISFFLFFFFLAFFHLDVAVYFLRLVNATGKGVILAQIFALGCVYIVYLAQMQGSDIIRYLDN